MHGGIGGAGGWEETARADHGMGGGDRIRGDHRIRQFDA